MTGTPLKLLQKALSFPSAFNGASAPLTGITECPRLSANLYESPVEPVLGKEDPPQDKITLSNDNVPFDVSTSKQEVFLMPFTFASQTISVVPEIYETSLSLTVTALSQTGKILLLSSSFTFNPISLSKSLTVSSGPNSLSAGYKNLSAS